MNNKVGFLHSQGIGRWSPPEREEKTLLAETICHIYYEWQAVRKFLKDS